MAAVGNLNDYVKYQMAQGMEQPGGGGAAGTASRARGGLRDRAADDAAERRRHAGNPAGGSRGHARRACCAGCRGHGCGHADLLSPAQVAQALGVSEEDVMAIITSGELAGEEDRRQLPHQACAALAGVCSQTVALGRWPTSPPSRSIPCAACGAQAEWNPARAAAGVPVLRHRGAVRGRRRDRRDRRDRSRAHAARDAGRSAGLAARHAARSSARAARR